LVVSDIYRIMIWVKQEDGCVESTLPGSLTDRSVMSER
jgi:hypothetical protein